MPDIHEHPGYLFVAATLLPLASFLLVLLARGVWAALRPYRETPAGYVLYNLFGGETPGRGPAYIALAAIAGAFILSLTGFILFTADQARFESARNDRERVVEELKERQKEAAGKEKDELGERIGREEGQVADVDRRWEARRHEAWNGRFDWVRIRP